MDPNCLDNTIDPEKIRPFEDEGYAVVEGALSADEVAALTARGRHLAGEPLHRSGQSSRRQPGPSRQRRSGGGHAGSGQGRLMRSLERRLWHARSPNQSPIVRQV